MKTRKFTLIELLAVMAIITILAGLTIGLVKTANEKKAEMKTQTRLPKLALLVEKYKRTRAGFPVQTNTAGVPLWTIFGGTDLKGVFRWQDPQTGKPLVTGLKSIAKGAKDKSGILPNIPDEFEDGWGNPFLYFYDPANPGLSKSGSFDIWSAGKDEVAGTADDYNNWTRND